MHTHIDNISTHHAGHCMVSFDLRTKENVDNLKYHLTKNWYNASHLDA